MVWLKAIEVHYGDTPSSEPSDAIPVVDGNNGDINAGMKGKYVWLVPRYSDDPSSAPSSIRIIIQDDADHNRDDMAKGAGGKYRYIDLQYGEGEKIKRVSLLRRKDSVSYNTIHSLGFDGYSGDINSGRGGDYLYIVWKTH
ncbi:hypothetical protein BDV25DRAFT_48398 [Aspergillus avenaceus]|uniref:MABP domain-containing protein n=1 Tax=Aspergillus avenaceus TaxID=36643 RepID=A0A5N6TKE6_ASPAV|nr:hypothetical protein BDV25DRAFT_48398 [Aspergillus avenaceus]